MGEIDGGFGMAGAYQHAAFLRAQREDVAGLDDVFRAHARRDGGLDGVGAVGGGDAGGDAAGRFDGYGEVSAVLGAVFLGHQRQAEFVHQCVFHRQAHQAARVFDHKVDGFGGNELGGHHQIAFVFAVFGIGDDDHAAGFDVGQDFGYGRDLAHGVRLSVRDFCGRSKRDRQCRQAPSAGSATAPSTGQGSAGRVGRRAGGRIRR